MKAAGEKIACVTAYDVNSAEIAEAAGVDLVLVGDSVGNVLLGYESTVPVELWEMQHHVRAVARVCRRPLLVGDLPFGSYHEGPEQAVRSSVALMKAGAEAVKLEGDYTAEVQAIVRAGIPCMGHLGFTPQSVHAFGGHRVQGKGEAGDKVLDQARRLQDSGVFAIVLELVPEELATRITQELQVPTVGIGAGPGCDGQIQVYHDVLGLSGQRFRHAKRYVEGRSTFEKGLSEYVQDVKNDKFRPGS
jgi:3-methyl-2-oxobutanoate hydroxymethyltransferase